MSSNDPSSTPPDANVAKSAKAAKAVKPGSGAARSARRRAREFAVQGVYEWLVSQSASAMIEADLASSPGYKLCDAEHLKVLLNGTINEYANLHARIEPHLDRRVEQVSPVERAVLLTATYELVHHPEIPYRVVISEAIDLTKVFGGTDGYRFVNGVLDRVAADCGVAEGRR